MAYHPHNITPPRVFFTCRCQSAAPKVGSVWVPSRGEFLIFDVICITKWRHFYLQMTSFFIDDDKSGFPPLGFPYTLQSCRAPRGLFFLTFFSSFGRASTDVVEFLTSCSKSVENKEDKNTWYEPKGGYDLQISAVLIMHDADSLYGSHAQWHCW